MYSDTHFHFRQTWQNSTQGNGKEFLQTMAETNIFFGMDIGTEADDLISRRDFLIQAINTLDEKNKAVINKMIHFSAGIWPDPDSIRERENRMAILKDQIKSFCQPDQPFHDRLTAIGEGGIDHHWNPSGPDGRKEEDFNKALLEGEKELFHMQLDLAKSLNLPFIVHSREGFKDTLDVIKAADSHCGIIHCYTYGIDEAKVFLDQGYYISFSGSQTYTKKSKLQQTIDLIRYIPSDRLLLETDAPYLTPVPLRGQVTNNPSLVKYTYSFVAQHRGISVEELCNLVDSNCKTLFKL